MRLHLPATLKKALLKSFIAAATMLPCTLYAGHMDADVGYELYRNLGENRGPFEAGATNVMVYDIHGKELGVIPIVPDFSAVSNPGTAASLAGGQSWLADCQHNRVISNIKWGIRFGTYDTPVYEEYRNINRVEGGYNESFFDLSISRLSKVVTDVVHWEFVSDERYANDADFLADKYIWRVGAGNQQIYTYPDGEGEWLNVAYETITAGTGKVIRIEDWTRTVTNERGETLTVHVDNQVLGTLSETDKENILPILGWGGDSGSPLLVYNEDTKSFQLMGIFYGYNYRGGTVWDSYHTYNFNSKEFFDFVIDSSAYAFDKTETKWTFSASDSDGFVKVTSGILDDLGDPLRTHDSIRTLKQGERGDTSTLGTLASDEEMWESLDWVFQSDAETKLIFEGSFNSGAGTFQFLRGEGATSADPTSYKLSASDATVNVSNAGYIIEEHVKVISSLTGVEGDEWRIVGENARMDADMQYEIYGGYFEITGTGDNLADLNLGVGVTVFLNRQGGAQAADDVQINTGSTVMLGSSTQIGGNVEFGHMGGLLNLNGHDFARTSSNLFVFDKDAGFANFAQTGEATFDYTIEGAVHEDMHAFFADSSSLIAGSTGVLHVNISADTAGASMTLDNHINIAGDLVLNAVDTTLSGSRVEIANPDMTVNMNNYEPAYDPEQWVRSKMNVGRIVAQNHTNLVLGPHVDVSSDDLTVEAGSTLLTTSTSTFTGTMNIHGQGTFGEGSTITGAANVHSGGVLDVSVGGVYDVDFSIMSGGFAQFAGDTELQGLLMNAGKVSFDGHLSIMQTMTNTGDLNFASDLLFDVSNLTGVTVGGETTYRVFTGSDSLSFGSLTSNNVVGEGAENLKWTFYDDGRLVSSVLLAELEYRGGDLGLQVDVGGFVAGTFQDGEAIHFTTGSSVMTLQANLSSDRLFVDGVSLEIVSNGSTLHVDRLLMSDGSSLTLQGEALQSTARVTRLNDARNISVHIQAQGQSLSEKLWLQEFTGHVKVSNGSYHAGQTDAGYLSLELEGENTTFTTQGASDLQFALRGNGVLQALDVTELVFHDIDEFSGRIATTADRIDFNTVTAASMELVANNTLHLNVAGSYSGTFSGAGDIYAHVSETTISALNDFTGMLSHETGTLTVSGQSTSMEHFSMGDTGEVNILAGSHFSTTLDSERQVSDFRINIGEGAVLEESLIQQRVAGGTLTIGGGGTVKWEGLMLSSEDAQGNLVVEAGTTLHLLSGSQLRSPYDEASFMLSNYNYHNEVTIHGTIITNANLTSGSGYATLSVEDGGVLEIKKGLVFDTGHRGASYIRVRDGGTLLIANQATYSRDYGDPNWAHRLETHLESGGTLGVSGTGIVTTPHTFRWAETGNVNIKALDEQDFRLDRDVLGGGVTMLGGGIVRINAINVANLKVESDTELYMRDASITLQNFELDGVARLAHAHTADYAISGASTGELHFTDRLEAMDMTSYAGTVHMATGSEFVLHSSMQAGAKLLVAEDSHVELKDAVSFSNTQSETRTGNYRFTVGAGAQLREDTVDYELVSGKTLTVEGAGEYRARSMQLSGESLVFGTDSNLSLATLSTTGNARVNFAQGAKLSADVATIASGHLLELSGEGAFSANTTVAGQVSFLAGADQQGSMTLSGTDALVSFSGDSSLTGDVTLTAAASHLDLSQGGVHSGLITLHDGKLTLGSQLTFSQAIVGSSAAELELSNNVIFDISNLTAGYDEDGTIVYTIFTGMSSAEFGALQTNSIIGKNSLNYDWAFSDDGTVRGTAIDNELFYGGGGLSLYVGATGFDDEELFNDKAKINFYGADTTLSVRDAGMTVDRIVVTGVQLEVLSGAHQLEAGNIILTEGASLVVNGDMLNDSSRVLEEAAAQHTEVILDMAGGELAAQQWFTNYTGKVSLQDGTYHFDANAMNHRETEVRADAILQLGDLDRMTNSISGTGDVYSSALESVTFDDLINFSGLLDTSAQIVNLQSTTSARFSVDAGSTVNLSVSGGLYDGAISGTGLLLSNSAEATTTVSNLGADFTGSLQLQSGTLEIGGDVSTITAITQESNTTLHLLAGTKIDAATTGYRTSRDYSVHLEAGSVLDESGVILSLSAGNFSLSGEGTYVVNGLEMGMTLEKNTVTIGENSTLHITGDDFDPSDGSASFLVSYAGTEIGNRQATTILEIYGTLISDVGMSAKNGKSNINIYDGGVLELRKGGMYNGSDTYADPHLNVYAGGILLMGNQDNTTNYGVGYNTLGLHLWDGSTIGGAESGRIDIYHTFWGVATATGIVNIWSQGDQQLHFHEAIKHQNLNIHGGGAVSIHANGVVRNYSIETAELNFQQENLSLESLTIRGRATVSMGSAALETPAAGTRTVTVGTGVLTTDELHIEAGIFKSLNVDNSIGSLNVDTLQIQNRGDMKLSARDSRTAALVTSSLIDNIHLENVTLSDASKVTLQYSQLSNSNITDSSLYLVDENIILNSTIGANVSFELDDSASLIIENSVISHMNENLLTQVEGSILSINDMVTVKDSTLQIENDKITTSQATLDGDAFNLYSVEGVALLLDEATIEGELIVDLMGLSIGDFQGVSYGIEILGLSSGTTMDLSQLRWQVEGADLEFNARYDSSGNLVLVYESAIPEPSTATLSLLALTALLGCRRRKIE